MPYFTDGAGPESKLPKVPELRQGRGQQEVDSGVKDPRAHSRVPTRPRAGL